MPSPSFIPFSNDRFDIRSNGSDVNRGRGAHKDDENPICLIRRSVRRHPPVAHSETAPYSEMEALMRCAPHEEPEASVESTFLARDMVDGLLSSLEPRERYVIEGLFYEGLSLREMGRVLSMSKDTVAKIRDVALNYMHRQLSFGDRNA